MTVAQVPNEKSLYEAKCSGQILTAHPHGGKYTALCISPMEFNGTKANN